MDVDMPLANSENTTQNERVRERGDRWEMVIYEVSFLLHILLISQI